jgi:hypothetical protein
MRRILLIFILLICSTTVSLSQQIKPMLGEQLNRSHPLARGLVGCWLMNEGRGSTIQDSSNRLQGIGNVIPTRIADYTNYNGTTQKWTLSSCPFDPEQQFSLLAEIRIPSISAEQMFLGFGDVSGGSGARVNFGLYSDGKFRLQLRRNGNTTIVNLFSVGSSLADNRWHKLAFTFNGVTRAYKAYVDGKLLTSGTSDTFTAIDFTKGSIGSHYHAGDYNFYWSGDIKTISIYNRALSNAEVAQLYREPFAMFDTYPVWWFYIFGEGGEGAGGQMIFGGQRILDGGVVR